LLAGNISAGTFKDHSFNKEKACGYIVFAKSKSGALSPHSAEVSNIHIYLDDQLASGKTEGIRQFAAIQIGREISMGYRADPDFVRRIFEIVPPASPYWVVETYLFFELSHYVDDQTADRLLWQFLRENPDRVTRGLVLAQATAEAHATENSDKLAALYEELKTNYTDLKLFDIHFALRAYNPNKNVIAGNPLPDFQLSLLNSDEIVTKESLMGRYYLIDFWATWCGPCVAEMPNLHEVHKKFRDKNFAILSISFDRKPEDIQKFRENKWKMPWQHIFVDGEEREKLSNDFEVVGIPKPILVGPDGVILAIDGELRGTRLEQTLSKYLGDDTTEGDANE
jgi:thiol-disulfide isomerase/thioredoxin